MIVLVIHITSNSIEASLVRDVHKDSPEVFLEQSISLKDGLKKYIQDVHKELKQTKEKVGKILCILGGSFSNAETRILTYNDKNPFIIDKNIISQLIEENSNKTKNNQIEKEVIHTKVNGYDTDSSLGKEATLIELTVFQSAASNAIKEDIKEQVQSLSSNIVFHTFPYIAFKAFSASRLAHSPYLLIEIEKGISTFSLIKDNSFLETTSFDKGSDFILKNLMKDLNVDEKVALSLLKMKIDNSILPETKERVELSLNKSEKMWQQETYKALALLSQGLPIPQEMNVIAPKFWKHFFIQGLQKNDYNQFSYGNGSFIPALSESTYMDCIKLFIKNQLL